MRGYHSYHGNFGDWIVRGFAIALGFMLLNFVLGGLVLVAMVAWAATEKSKPFFRGSARGIFVVLVIVAILTGIAILFTE